MLDVLNSILKSYQKNHSLPNSIKDISKDKEPVQTSKLKPMIEERGLADKICIFEVDHESETILATIHMVGETTAMYSGTKDVARIYYQKGLNKCWRRFVICKEMYHCMLDRTEAERVCSMEGLSRLVELLSQDTTTVSGPFAPFQTEQQAELLALETLIPVEYRLQMKDDFATGKNSAHDIAKMFRVPEAYIPFSMQPTYLNLIRAYRTPLLF